MIGKYVEAGPPKRTAYERQKGKCKNYKIPFDISKMKDGRIDPWSKGGKTIAGNNPDVV